MTSLTLPNYGRGALSDLMPSALGALGVPGEANVLGLPNSESVCVLLIDGLGWHLLRQHADIAPFLASLNVARTPLTCGVPSTTVTSLTSLGTGLEPGKHGVVGYTSRVEIDGTALLLNGLDWNPRIDPRDYQPYPTVFERCAGAGVRTGVITKARFRKSGLTLAALRGPGFAGADTTGETVSAAVAALSGPGPRLVYVYDSDLDATGHRRGVGSAAWRYQLAAVDRFAEALADELPSRCALVITGDHGMLDVPTDSRIDVDVEPTLLRNVQLIGGEARFRHVYTDVGAASDVADAWRQRLGSTGVVMTRAQAIAAGWFGPVDASVAPRIGDVVVAAQGNTALLVPSAFPMETRLIGFHGSMSPEEMLVPLLVTTGG